MLIVTISSTGPDFTTSQLAFAGITSFVLYGGFLFFQSASHRDYYLPKAKDLLRSWASMSMMMSKGGWPKTDTVMRYLKGLSPNYWLEKLTIFETKKGYCRHDHLQLTQKSTKPSPQTIREVVHESTIKKLFIRNANIKFLISRNKFFRQGRNIYPK